jgi:hypothetical protein
MYTKKKNIIICKFNLNNKCKFEEKCRFQHISVNELNDIINKYQDLKQENASLKLMLKEKSLKLSNLEKKSCDVTTDNVHALVKPSYNSFFKTNNFSDQPKIRTNKIEEEPKKMLGEYINDKTSSKLRSQPSAKEPPDTLNKDSILKMIQSFHQEKVIATLLAKNAENINTNSENIKQLRVNYDELNATLKSFTTDVTLLHTANVASNAKLDKILSIMSLILHPKTSEHANQKQIIIH